MTAGGKRKGAGRKPAPESLKKVQLGLKLPQWLIDWLDSQTESRAVVIEDALRRRHKLEPPEA